MRLCAAVKPAHELFPLEVTPHPPIFPFFLSLFKFLSVRRGPPPPLSFEMYRWQNNGELPCL